MIKIELTKTEVEVILDSLKYSLANLDDLTEAMYFDSKIPYTEVSLNFLIKHLNKSCKEN